MDQIIRELQDLAEYHASQSGQMNDVEAARALTCGVAAAMLRGMVDKTPTDLKEGE